MFQEKRTQEQLRYKDFLSKLENDFIDEVIDWSNKRDRSALGKWKQICMGYLLLWDWNSKAAEDFFNWGEGGFNNTKLQVPNTFEEFYSEIHYCSDIMDLDRLFRCHMLYRNIDLEL